MLRLLAAPTPWLVGGALHWKATTSSTRAGSRLAERRSTKSASCTAKAPASADALKNWIVQLAADLRTSDTTSPFSDDLPDNKPDLNVDADELARAAGRFNKDKSKRVAIHNSTLKSNVADVEVMLSIEVHDHWAAIFSLDAMRAATVGLTRAGNALPTAADNAAYAAAIVALDDYIQDKLGESQTAKVKHGTTGTHPDTDKHQEACEDEQLYVAMGNILANAAERRIRSGSSGS